MGKLYITNDRLKLKCQVDKDLMSRISPYVQYKARFAESDVTIESNRVDPRIVLDYIYTERLPTYDKFSGFIMLCNKWQIRSEFMEKFWRYVIICVQTTNSLEDIIWRHMYHMSIIMFPDYAIQSIQKQYTYLYFIGCRDIYGDSSIMREYLQKGMQPLFNQALKKFMSALTLDDIKDVFNECSNTIEGQVKEDVFNGCKYISNL